MIKDWFQRDVQRKRADLLVLGVRYRVVLQGRPSPLSSQTAELRDLNGDPGEVRKCESHRGRVSYRGLGGRSKRAPRLCVGVWGLAEMWTASVHLEKRLLAGGFGLDGATLPLS